MIKDKNLKETGTNEKKKSWIFYLNDDSSPTSAYVEIIEISDFVVFRTNDNIIKLPASRILKIKERIK